ncbi:hypothetical protein [Paenarthrobacter nitroguajacolicus]|uniref:hypothetical protein n=1 Tax=Paenarthrobacter nitroguajacolicus TaxID=211146 RepID=UPI0021195F22|nr:hypothetical protein [Paenarthrobacter nitroguajacolicus]
MDVIREAKIRLEEGSAPDLTWEMELVPGKKPGVPDSMELSYAFGDEEVSFERFNTSPATRVRLVAMRNNFLNSEALVIDGLQRLSYEAYGPEGFARGSDEVIHVLIHRGSRTMGYGYLIAGAQKTSRGLKGGKDEFSREALHDWLDECRDLAYSPGIGTWTTAEVHVFPDKPGRLDFFEEERLRKMSNGRWYPGAEPADADVWTKQLRRYPRTADNIPSWMWDVFRAEGVTPPIYNPEFKSVDWKNRRRPVTERGADLTVEPTVINPSLEPGVFAKISKKLFGA